MNYFRFVIIFILILVTLLNCAKESNLFKLPLNENNIWYYDATGYMSAEKYLPLPPALGDTLTSESHYFKKIPERDTIKIYIKEIKKIGKDSTFYKFSEDFVRFWGSEILLVKDGYKRYFQDCKETYLIKFPIKVNQTWENRFYLVSEKCTISSIDTTISFDGLTYHNCLSIKIQQYREADKYFIKVYFNEEYGLVYYVDYKSGDEIKLLKMETL